MPPDYRTHARPCACALDGSEVRVCLSVSRFFTWSRFESDPLLHLLRLTQPIGAHRSEGPRVGAAAHVQGHHSRFLRPCACCSHRAYPTPDSVHLPTHMLQLCTSNFATTWPPTWSRTASVKSAQARSHEAAPTLGIASRQARPYASLHCVVVLVVLGSLARPTPRLSHPSVLPRRIHRSSEGRALKRRPCK